MEKEGKVELSTAPQCAVMVDQNSPVESVPKPEHRLVLR